MGKRPAHSYRQLQEPYTQKKYINRMQDLPEGLRHSVFGNSSKFDFPAKVRLIALRDIQVSARALLAARVSINRELRVIGEDKYRLNMTSYPHHQTRSHGLVGVAKAERIFGGMGGGSFGFPEMRMAQIHKGHALLEITTDDDPVALGIIRRALKMGFSKLPLKWQIEITGFSRETLNAKVNLAKRVKEKKGTSGQQVADLQRELK